MTNSFEHAIGDRFEVCHLIYEVRQADSCNGCSLYINEENECVARDRRFGQCSASYRTDGQNVKFVKVGEAIY